MWCILESYGGYVAKGSYIFAGEKYAVITRDLSLARKFKAKQAAKNALIKMATTRANIDTSYCYVIEKNE